MNRIAFLGAIATLALGAGPAAAQSSLTIGMYGGSFEKAMREIVVPAFQKQHKVDFQYVAGNSTDTLARMQAQKAKQEIDIAFLDDGVMFQAVALGFCAPLADGPVYKDLYDIARIPGNKAVAAGFVATGITYNKKYFGEKGWPAPTSWKDIADPKYKKLLAMSPITGTYGLHTLVMMARVNGGGEKNIDPGFKAMQAVAANIQTFPPSPAKMSESLQAGETVISIWGSGRTVALANTGFPVEFVYPKEGAVALMVGVCPVAKPDASELAQKFIQFNLTPEMQAVWAKEQGFGPVNKNAKLEPDVAKQVPYGPDQVSKLVAVDWDTMNKEREAWTKRWQREIER
ncbi:MAG: ABC transporter substrate-binding protein [Alphaproteobacteria bacterium]|nr:ABC transporter substrate-binding protein [Alphaproteobacteria bacterium]